MGPLQVAMGIGSVTVLAVAVFGTIYIIFVGGISLFEHLNAPNPARALMGLGLGTVLLVTFATRLPQVITWRDLAARDWTMLGLGVALLLVAAQQGGIVS
jgi:hypothetical protein